jgi:hypothetical protein
MISQENYFSDQPTSFFVQENSAVNVGSTIWILIKKGKFSLYSEESGTTKKTNSLSIIFCSMAEGGAILRKNLGIIELSIWLKIGLKH